MWDNSQPNHRESGDAEMETTRSLRIGSGTWCAALAVVVLLGWVAPGWADQLQETFPVIRLGGCDSWEPPQILWRPASQLREVRQDEIPSWVFSGSRLAYLPVTQPGDLGYEVWAAVNEEAGPDPEEGPFPPSKFEGWIAIHTLELDIDAKSGDLPTSEHWYSMPLCCPVDEPDEEEVETEEELEAGTFFAMEAPIPVLTAVDPDHPWLVKVTLTTLDSAMRAWFLSKRALVLQIQRPSPEVLLAATGCYWAAGGRCWDWKVDRQTLACTASWIGIRGWNLLCKRTLFPHDELRAARAVSTFRIGDDPSSASNGQAHREPRLELAEVAALVQGSGGMTSQFFRTADGGLATPVGRVVLSEEREARVVVHFPPRWPGRPRPAVVFLERGLPVKVVEPDPATWTPDPEGFFERKELPGDFEVDDVASKLVSVGGSGSFRAVEVLSRWGGDWWLSLVGVSWDEGAPTAGVFSLARLVRFSYLSDCDTYFVPSTAFEIKGGSLGEGKLRCRVQGPVRCPVDSDEACEWLRKDDRSDLAGSSAPYEGEVSWQDGGWHVELPEKDPKQFVLLPELDRDGSRFVPVPTPKAFYPDSLRHRLDQIFGSSDPEGPSDSP